MHPRHSMNGSIRQITLLLVLMTCLGPACNTQEAPSSSTPPSAEHSQQPAASEKASTTLPEENAEPVAKDEVPAFDWNNSPAVPLDDYIGIESPFPGSGGNLGKDAPKSNDSAPTEPTDSVVTAETLGQAFVANEAEAKQKYVGKTLKISGSIVSEAILRDDVLLLWGGLRDTEFDIPLDALLSISFDNPIELKQLVIGQSIVCTAQCVDGSSSSASFGSGKLVSAGSQTIDLKRLDLKSAGLPLTIMGPKDARVIQRGDQVRVFGLGMDLAIEKNASDQISAIKESPNMKILLERPNLLLYSFVPGLRTTVYSFFASVKIGEDNYEVTDFGIGTAHRAVAEGALEAAKSLSAASAIDN